MSDPTIPELPLYRAVVEYDGAGLLGFQLQHQGPTVQGEIERVLVRLTQQPVRVIGSGRTDAGVHARGQVIAFRTQWRHSLADLQRGMNALLPDAISVRALELAPPQFHPRFSALDRWYRYQVGRWLGHSPLYSRYAWEISSTLDIAMMNQAASSLLGTHDFRTFGQPTQGESTVRHVISAHWHEDTTHPDRPYLYFDIRASGFLRHMVRNIVSTLIRVGQHFISADEFADLLASQNRSLSAPPAPPQGLILMAVTYPQNYE